MMVHARRARRGFTLVESMATVSVLAVLGSITSFLILEAVDGFTDAGSSLQLHTELSIAMDRALREVRSIRVDDTATGLAPDINNVTPSWLDWEDADGDGYQILYNNGEGTLKLERDGGGLAVLLTDVTACVIAVYDEDNTKLAWILGGDGCDPVRRAELDVTVERNGVTESLRARTYIRSMMILEAP